jgi:hypothetical protein
MITSVKALLTITISPASLDIGTIYCDRDETIIGCNDVVEVYTKASQQEAEILGY